MKLSQVLATACLIVLFGWTSSSCSKSAGSAECKKACAHVEGISKDQSHEFDMGGCVHFCDQNKYMVPCIMKAKTIKDVNDCG